MSQLTLNDHLEIISSRRNDPDFKRKLKVTDHGHGHLSVQLEPKDFKNLLTKKRNQEKGPLFKLLGLRF